MLGKSNRNKHFATGFTLIELLVVLVIIGIITSFALLATGDWGAKRRAQATAEELTLLLRNLDEQAILQPAILGMAIHAQQYQFYQLKLSTKGGQWQRLGKNSPYRPRDIAAGIQAQVQQSDDHTNLLNIKNNPSLIIFEDGSLTPFTITIGNKDHPNWYHIRGYANGSIKMQ